jgi:hypothetical protein
VEVESCHTLPKLLGRDLAVAVRVKERKGPAHVEALEEEGGGHFVPDLEETALPEVCSLESGAEILDDDLATLLWVGDPPEKAVILHREGKIELSDPLFEVLHGDEAGLRVERVVQALKAVEEGDSSLLEEADDPALQGLHSSGLGLAEVLLVNLAQPGDLFAVLALEFGH